MKVRRTKPRYSGKKIFSQIEREQAKTAEIIQEDIAQLISIAKLRSSNSVEAESYLRSALNKLRDLAFEIKPQILDRFGLFHALEELLKRRLGGHFKLTVETETDSMLDKLTRIAIFRLVQQILSNTDIYSFENFNLRIERSGDWVCTKIIFENLRSNPHIFAKDALNQLQSSVDLILYLHNGFQESLVSQQTVQLHLFLRLSRRG